MHVVLVAIPSKSLMLKCNEKDKVNVYLRNSHLMSMMQNCTSIQ